MKKFTIKSILRILFLTFLIGIAASYYQFTQKPTEIENNITTLSGKITPLYYTNSTLLNNFNKNNIDECQTAAGTYDIQTIASQITSTLLTAFSSSTEKPLPLIANWNVGIPEYSDGLDPLYMINRLIDGEHLLPTWKIDPYFNNTIGLNYYEASVKKAAELGLPLVFILPSPESALTQDDVYFNMDKTQNPNVITTNGTVLPELSPFAPDGLWKEVGGQWSTTSLMAQLQEWYPNPPLIVFIDEDISKKLSWNKLTTSSRYLLEYPTDTSNEFKRTLVNAKWLEKYRQLHEGFQQGFTKTAWKQNVKFITRNQLASNMGVTSDWMNSATTTNQYANIWPLTADGLTINFNLDGDKTDITNAPYTLLNNLPFMLDEAKKINPNFMYQLSIDANKKIDNPQRYRGFTQFALWFLRPNIIRQAPNTTTKDTINLLFQQVVDSVGLIYHSDILTDFWKNGKLVTTGNSGYNQNIPINYQSIPREFLLQTDTTMPLWSFALEKGVSPNREWLVYAQSPETNLTDVRLSIPNYRNIQIDTLQEGSFYVINETNTTQIITALVTTQSSPADTNKTIIGAQKSVYGYVAPSASEPFIKPTSYANILDYGAVGDGITDNNQAFANALAANPNVYIPDGIYKITSSITILSTTKTIFGTGTIGKFLPSETSSSANAIFTGTYQGTVSNLTINGLTIKGSIYFNWVNLSNITIQNCIFNGYAQSIYNAMSFVAQDRYTFNNLKIINNKFINISSYVIEMLTFWKDRLDPSVITNLLIKDNYFYRDTDAFQRSGGSTAISLAPGTNILLKNNYIDNYRTAFEVIDGVTAIRNTTRRSTNGTFMGATVLKNIVIEWNDFEAPNTGLGASVTSKNIIYSYNTIHGNLIMSNINSAIVAYNIIHATTTDGNLAIKHSSDIQVHNNIIENLTSGGIWSVISASGKETNSSTSIYNNTYYVPNGNVINPGVYLISASPTVSKNLQTTKNIFSDY